MVVLSNIASFYDGTSGDAKAVKKGMDLWIQDGKIHKVEPHQKATVQTDQLKVIDCSSYTVTPGMIDCHSHIVSLGIDGKGIDLMTTTQSLFFVEKILYTTLVDGGVTSARDVGGATHLMKRMVDAGVLIGPRLKVAICMLSTTGGHADFKSPDRCHSTAQRLWPEAPGRPSNVVDGPWECRKRVREIVACGADVIKICASPGVASPSDKLENRDFSAEEIAAICDEARGRGLEVIAHAHSANGIRMAIENGVADIQHISFMDQRLVEMAYAKGCAVTPTSWVMDVLPGRKEISPFVMDKVKQATAVHKQAVEFAAKGGLPILAGTDPVFPHMHGRNFLEISALISDGLSPTQAWFGATGLAAKKIGLADSGMLVPGMRADFLVAKGDVISKPALLETGLVEVVKDGVAYRGAIKEIPQRDFRTNLRSTLETMKPEYL